MGGPRGRPVWLRHAGRNEIRAKPERPTPIYTPLMLLM
jgi:hypothetical protein